MKRLFLYVLLISAVIFPAASQQSGREDRKLVATGNNYYRSGEFKAAGNSYQEALNKNPNNHVARYNLALSQIKQASTENKEENEKFLNSAVQNLTNVSRLIKDNPSLASKASYNLGNISFNSQDYKGAIEHYKQSLRLTPNNEQTRKNLRIAQKKLQEEQNKDNDDKDKEKNKDKKENQDKDQQDNNQNQQDQPEKEDQKNNDQQNQPQERISEQSAEQILNAVENKEKDTRNKIQSRNYGTQVKNRKTSPIKKW